MQLLTQSSKHSVHTLFSHYKSDSEVFNSAHHNLWLKMGLCQVLHPVEGDHNPAFHKSANCVLAESKLLHIRKNQFPPGHI